MKDKEARMAADPRTAAKTVTVSMRDGTRCSANRRKDSYHAMLKSTERVGRYAWTSNVVTLV
jgi:hypothetical protein